MSEYLKTLTPEKARELLNTTQTRGENEQILQDLADSGELGVNASEFFPGKDYQAIRQGLRMTIEKKAEKNDWPKFSIGVDKVDQKDKSTWQVYVLNTEVLAELENAESTENEQDEEVAA